MKPAKFNYLAPTSIKEALLYLDTYGDDCKLISGGQSFVPVLNMRLSTPEYVIDLTKIKELSYITIGKDFVHIGATTRHVDVERSKDIANNCGILSKAIQFVGNSQIRNRGTIGGTIAHADPASEVCCVLAALRGNIVTNSKANGRNIVSPEEFFLTYMLTTLDSSEMIEEVQFPILKKRTGYSFKEISRRHGDFALVAAAATIDLDEHNKVARCQLAIGGANAVPTILYDVEEAIIGRLPTDESVEEALDEAVQNELDPEGDLHGSAEYRLQLAYTLGRRALVEAYEDAIEKSKVE